jgi:hypothetical protein
MHRADPSEELYPIHPRHPQIREHDRKVPFPFQDLQGLRGTVRHVDVKPPSQTEPNPFDDVGFVIHNENPLRSLSNPLVAS